MVGGYTGRYLLIDLSAATAKPVKVPGERALPYLGSKGVAARLLYELLPPQVDPLSPDNIVVINSGPLTGSGAPGSSRFNLSTKSPATGLIASSNCGGPFGLALKKAGYDGLILQGKAAARTWLEIDTGGVIMHDAAALWGKGALEVQELAPGGKGKLAIGPAGENLVHFASALSGERVLARCGVGAVLGSKNLKGISVSGNGGKIPISDPAALRERLKAWTEAMKVHPVTGSMLPEFGTGVLVNRCDATMLLPTCNFREGTFPDAESISGEEIAERYKVERMGCTGCPVRCGRRIPDPRDGSRKVRGPEYETLALLGSNLCVSSLPRIIEWNRLCDELGLDTISTGGVLGTAMELGKLGALDGGVSFGETHGVAEVIEKIAHRDGVGDLMADGAKRLAEECGHPELAPHSRGLELPGYNPRFAWGHGLGYAVASRGGCHLDGGYMAFVEGAGTNLLDPHSAIGKATLTVFMQDLIQAVSASGACVFSAFLLFPRWITEKLVSVRVPSLVAKGVTQSARALWVLDYIPRRALAFNLPLSLLPFPRVLEAVTGQRFSFGSFLETGARIFDLERSFNLREGFDPRDDALAERFMHDAEPGVQGRAVPLEAMLPAFYKARHWSKEGVTAKAFLQPAISIADEKLSSDDRGLACLTSSSN